HRDYAQSLNDLGVLYCAQGNYAAAEPRLQEALEVRQRALGGEHRDYARTLNSLGVLYRAQGNYAAARPLLEKALQIMRAADGDSHSRVAVFAKNYASVLSQLGCHDEARQYE